MNTSRTASLPVRLILTVMTLALMVMIFLLSTEPAEKSDNTSGRISEAVDRILYPDWDEMSDEEKQPIYSTTQTVVRKTAHFTEYAMLGALLLLTLRSWFGPGIHLRLIAWGGGTFYAMTDELHQLLVDGRSGQWTDVLLDSAGVLTGTLIAFVLLRKILKRREMKKTEPSPNA